MSRVANVDPLVSALRGLRHVEAQHRQQHSYLEASDDCWFVADYHAGSDRAEINRLIYNWKCPPSVAMLTARNVRSKENAIDTVAAVLRRSCDRRWAEESTWCPIPPSRVIGSPDYDDRLWRAVSIAFEGYDLDLRMLLLQTTTTTADHTLLRRLKSQHLYEVLQINLEAVRQRPLRRRIILFDDLLTSGKHFKCCQHRLHEVVPGIAVSGLFFARRVQFSRWCSERPA